MNQINYLNQELQQIKQMYIDIEVKKDNLLLENNELKVHNSKLEEIRDQEIEIKEETIKHLTEL